MLNSIHAFSKHIFYFSQEKALSYLSQQQKKIILIASLAFGLLAACYIAIRYSNGSLLSFIGLSRQMNQEEELRQVPASHQKQVNQKTFEQEEIYTLPPLTSLQEAMELMFTDRKLEWGILLDPLTPEQETEKHENLKKAIGNVLPEDIDKLIAYRDGMIGREQTLLLQAIMHIKDPSRRLEIVKMLIEKGADPRVQGCYYSRVDPIEEAEKTQDLQLIQLLNDVLKQKEF